MEAASAWRLLPERPPHPARGRRASTAIGIILATVACALALAAHAHAAPGGPAGAVPPRLAQPAKPAGAAKQKPPAKVEATPKASSRGDARFDEARRRYAEALGVKLQEGRPDPKLPAGFERRPDKPVLTFDRAGVGLLLQQGWRGPGIKADPPRQQIRRNRGFIALARALEIDPAIGAAQASFGTPAENGLAKLADAIEAARFDLAGSPAAPGLATRVHEQERELEAALARLPRGPGKGWALVELDLNKDRRIDGKDIDLAKAGKRLPGHPLRSAALAATAARPRN